MKIADARMTDARPPQQTCCSNSAIGECPIGAPASQFRALEASPERGGQEARRSDVTLRDGTTGVDDLPNSTYLHRPQRSVTLNRSNSRSAQILRDFACWCPHGRFSWECPFILKRSSFRRVGRTRGDLRKPLRLTRTGVARALPPSVMTVSPPCTIGRSRE